MELRTLGKIRRPRDLRNYSMKHPKVIDYFTKTGILFKAENPKVLPSSVDNRIYCSPVKNQGSLGACVSFTTTAILEYLEKLNYNNYIDASELYCYYKIDQYDPTSLNNCDGGSTVQHGMNELKTIGIPPTSCYPYMERCPLPLIPSQCDIEASNYKAISYVDLYQGTSDLQQVINNIKANVSEKIPVAFGFYVYSQPYSDNTNGEWYLPCVTDSEIGGHSVQIVGYDDNKIIQNPHCNMNTLGAFIIKNSWGLGWGINGFGWIPYNYILDSRFSDEAFIITGITTPLSCPTLTTSLSI